MRRLTKSFSGDPVRGEPIWNGGPVGNEAGEVDLALNALQKAAVKAAMKVDGGEKRVRSTLRDLAGQGFTPSELERLEERMSDTATWDDASKPWVIESGAPVVISPNQKAVIDGLFGRLGGDPLAERARSSYRRALQSGRVQVG